VKKDLILYHKHALRLLDRLETVKLEHVPTGVNKVVDALAKLVATLELGAKENIKVSVWGQWVITPADYGDEKEVKVVSAYVVDKQDWRQLLIDYLKHGSCQVTWDIRQKFNKEPHTSSITKEYGTDALSSISGYDVWIKKKGNG